MTILDKLLIKGIRSYNPNDSNTIEFTNPMTLIVGSNGTGKTTIIECLKYITTGNLPPNSKGGAFLYDPRLLREVDLKAIVKLSFKNSKGNKMVCSRTLQGTQKGNKIEQKTLESILYEENNNLIYLKQGENELNHFFNISQSMLENVIFCHQDESTWPLSEPANVKKKFDDIFSSTKYSKALESLKATKRNITTQIKLKYQELEYLYKLKEKKNEMERRLENCKKDLEIKSNKEELLSKEFKTCSVLLEEIIKEIERVDLINQKLKKKEEEINTLSNLLLKNKEMNKEEALHKIKKSGLPSLNQEISNLNLIFKNRENEFKEIYAKKELYEMHKQKANKIQEEKHKMKILKEEIKGDEENLKKEIKMMKGKMVRKIGFGDYSNDRCGLNQNDKDSIQILNFNDQGNGRNDQKNILNNTPTLNTFNSNTLNSNTPISLNSYFVYQNIFNSIFEDFDFQLNSKKLKLNKLEDEISLLKEGIRSKAEEINENNFSLSNLISNYIFFEDDPFFDTNVSYENLIKKLKENLAENEMKNLIKKQEDLQMKYQEELKKNKEIYEMNKKRERVKEIKREIIVNLEEKGESYGGDESKGKENIDMEDKENFYKENLNFKLKICKEKIKKNQEIKNKIQFYEEILENLRKKMNPEKINLILRELKGMGVKIEEGDDRVNDKGSSEPLEQCSKLIEDNSVLNFTLPPTPHTSLPQTLNQIKSLLQSSSKVSGSIEIIYSNLIKIGLKKEECPICKSHLENPNEFKKRLEKIISKAPDLNKEKIQKLEEVYNLIKENLKLKNEEEYIKKIRLIKNEIKNDDRDEIRLIKNDNIYINDINIILFLLNKDKDLLENKLKLINELQILKNQIKEMPNVNPQQTEEEIKILNLQILRKKNENEEIKKEIENLEEKEKNILKIKENRNKIKLKNGIKLKINELEKKRDEERKDLELKEILHKNKLKLYEISKENLFKKKIKIEEILRKIKQNEEILKEMKIEQKIEFDLESYESLKEEEYELKSKILKLEETRKKIKEDEEKAKRHLEHFENEEKIKKIKEEIKKIEGVVLRKYFKGGSSKVLDMGNIKGKGLDKGNMGLDERDIKGNIKGSPLLEPLSITPTLPPFLTNTPTLPLTNTPTLSPPLTNTPTLSPPLINTPTLPLTNTPTLSPPLTNTPTLSPPLINTPTLPLTNTPTLSPPLTNTPTLSPPLINTHTLPLINTPTLPLTNTLPSLQSLLNSLLNNKSSLVLKKDSLLKDKSLLKGEMNQLQINKSQIEKELDLEFKNIIKDYNKSYVSHKILDLSLKDLDKLILSLDKAILDFHSFKIKEVNKILKDLWISSYKGNDIDFIELKSESLSNKTYSYRINQIKNNVELEMRGRCSAGQKMLASILVRLALSQTFGINFNYLALDEPTTNLDKENIESLGNSLLKIIKESKIQLIIITHDEEFVSILGRESGEYFYRLSRNERGDSVIHRHSVY